MTKRRRSSLSAVLLVAGTPLLGLFQHCLLYLPGRMASAKQFSFSKILSSFGACYAFQVRYKDTDFWSAGTLTGTKDVE